MTMAFSGFLRRTSGCVTLAALLFLGPAPASAETFEEALALAYNTNPALQAERAHLRAVDESVPIALSGWHPSLSASAGRGMEYERDDDPKPEQGDVRPADAGVILSQPLFSGGRTVAETKAAEETVKQERAQLYATEQAVLVSAAGSYLDVLLAHGVLDLNAGNEHDLANMLEEARRRAAAGDITETDIAQVESRLEGAHGDRNSAEVTLSNGRTAYVRFIGQTPGVLTKPDINQPLPPSREQAVDLAVNISPAVLAAMHAERVSAANIDTAKANLLPSLALQGSELALRNPDIGTTHEEVSAVQLQLTIPLYTGGADYARVRAAYQDRSQQRFNLDETERIARQVVLQAWDQMLATSSNISLRRSQAQAALEARDGMLREQQQGVYRSVIDILNAEQELLVSRIAALQAEHDFAFAKIQLLAAVGEFTAEKLKLKVDLYDPQKHYAQSRNRWFGTGEGGKRE